MTSSNKYICIHGHYYQPPRENAWLEKIEQQDSAAPYPNWNARINFECYAPNATARILDQDGYIKKIVNNYSRISFNIGPTLFSWLEKEDPNTYRAIQEADRLGQQRYDGHGTAIAQAHSHLILPLANQRDKMTQIIWGIKDFEYRFGRKPAGMWLAETAVNTDTLEALVANGIRYTILAPRQAKAFRKLGAENWDTFKSGVESRMPYWCILPSGNKIALFFYDGGIAQGVAFDGLLNDGKRFAKRLLGGIDASAKPQLVQIATDGESYGHHHRYGEMALADCLNSIEEHATVSLTNYAAYLEKFPPTHEIMIHENSSWSCVHGVERWRSDCGCSSGGRPGWNQKWRAPLRATLDWLRDKLIPLYEAETSKLLKDIWTARDEYIEVLLHDRSTEVVQQFLKKFALKKLTQEEQTRALRLLEMQRNAMLMYTSCGWFFDEISGIETNQILQYALRAIRYAQQVGGVDLNEAFISRLEKAPSNVFENGAVSYQKNVMSSVVTLDRVGMHYAVSSIFEAKPEELPLFNYTASNEYLKRVEAGNQKLALGRTIVRSRVTQSDKRFSFAVLYLGQQNLIGNISIDMKTEVFEEMEAGILDAFHRHDLGEVIGIMQRHFGTQKYSIAHLFKDEKRKVLQQISLKTLQQADTAFREIYNDNYQLMSSMQRNNIPIPEVYYNAVRYVVNEDLSHFFEQSFLNIEELKRMQRQLEKWSIQLSNKDRFRLAANERITYEISKLRNTEVPLAHLDMLNEVFEILKKMGISLEIWQSQNQYFSMMKGYKNGDWVFASEAWKAAFYRLGEFLRVRSF
ncbi:MAG: DUF3536 domain-containing protein [Saprospiraceae bacterium]